MSTPEDWLRRNDLIREMGEAMAPLFDLVAAIRQGFLDQGGVSPETADILTVEVFRAYVIPAITPSPTPDSAGEP